MQVLRDIRDLSGLPGALHLAIGVFDGLHCGHQAVIRAALQAADSCPQPGSVVVVTFDPHPIRVISPDRAPRLLTSHRHKMRLMRSQQIGTVLVVNFDEAFARTTGRQFVEQLASAAQDLKTICVGSDWCFGYQRSGTVDLLRELGEQLGYAVVAVPTVSVDGTVASSTAIREAVTQGDFQMAAAMLGRPYTVLGTVVEGRQLGRQMGFPTANLRVHNEQLPPSGVYAVAARRHSAATGEGEGREAPLNREPKTNGAKMPTPSCGVGEPEAAIGPLHRGEVAGVANLGHRPTVDQGLPPRRQLEVHLFDFDDSLYGDDLEIRFVSRLRGEQKFADLDALQHQIRKDCDAARQAIFGPSDT